MQRVMDGEEPLPENTFRPGSNPAPKRAGTLSGEDRILALRNALADFHPRHHETLGPEFARELDTRGRIYGYRFKPDEPISARPIGKYNGIVEARAMQHMIDNNLDPRVAQHPDELVTYGGNGTVFPTWQHRALTMRFLEQMESDQTLVMYSGRPHGLFPSTRDAPRVVIANGMMVPNYSTPAEYERLAKMLDTMYGQMTAGSWMYIGPQGIVHGTTITLLNAARRLNLENLEGRVFVTSGLGGMSGAQAKAAVIAGAVGVIAEINPKAVQKRLEQGWLTEATDSLDTILARIEEARDVGEGVSIGYIGNIVDLWEVLRDEDVKVDFGSDQTSLHNPWNGGYYPVDMTIADAQKMMVENPTGFKQAVQESLKRQVNAINDLTRSGMYFWDYGNAFLKEAGEAGADVMKANGRFKFPSYVEHLMGPICFDYGFGPFRWVCTSGDPGDLERTDAIAAKVLERLARKAPDEIRQQYEDNLHWIREAGRNNLVVGSQARILYSDLEGRLALASAFNTAIKSGKVHAPIVIGRDHHDIGGTDSPYRETADIYDGTARTADMSVHNAIGLAARGATWVSLHNGGGVGWGQVMNGGFGMVLDGSSSTIRKARSMIGWDVTNGLARRSRAGHEGAQFAIERAMEKDKRLVVRLPHEPNMARLRNI
ncbi:MAG: urocanate hydratase [Nanoarchaeota archaeon]|nr:urocanate hydratase [Nanoarchaeota archaeon]